MKIANRAIGDLKSSVSSLGSNFAALGVVLAGAGALIGKNVQALARIETINAQTAQTIKTMGNAANISATQVEALAGKLEALTATEAETIQEGANLLLTFRNISNQAGAGNDIFNQTTAIMVDMGRALGEDASASAIRLGKALNDPITGLTALRKVGVGFTADQEAQIRALQTSGDMMGAQKVILAELQAQFGGSGAAFAQTFSGQLALLGHELGTVGEEATMAVMPALQSLVAELRNLIPVIGPQVKEALESVDWAGFAQTIANLAIFFVQNAAAIANTVGVLFALSTIFKTITVVMTAAKVAMVVYTGVMALMTAAKGGATIASTLLAVAMNAIPFVAIATAIGLVTVGLLGAADAANKASGAIEGVQPYVPVDNTSSGGRGRGRRQTTPAPVVPTFSTGGFSGAGAGASAAADEIAKANEAAVKAQEEAARKEAEILKKRKDAFKSFQDSVKSLFSSIKDSIMSAFDLPKLGNSITSVTKNIGKLLERTRGFSENIKKLAGLGLNSALLQQVIAAGPQEGGRLAESLASGGSAAIAQLNASYGEFGALASSIASTGTRAEFAGQQTVNNYSVNVTGGLATGADVGRAVVNAISTYERQSGAAWRA
jgi:vacuolar-type H+-ATPase subunit E/Vma4